MSKICQICQRKPKISISRSHSNIASKRKQGLNLHWKRVKDKRIRICTRCLKSFSK